MPDKDKRFDRNWQPYVDGLSRLVPIQSDQPGQYFVRNYTVKSLKMANGLILADLQEVVNMQGLKFLEGMLPDTKIVNIKGQLLFSTVVPDASE